MAGNIAKSFANMTLLYWEPKYSGSGVEYESSLPEITAKGWDLAFVLPCGTYKTSGLREMTIIENTYIFKKKQ